MLRRIFHNIKGRTAIAMAFACSLFFSCSSSENSGGEGKGKAIDTLSIAVTRTIDCMPWFVAHEHGLDSQLGIKLFLKEVGSYEDAEVAMVNDSVDAVMTDSLRAVYLFSRIEKIRKRNTVLLQEENALKKQLKKAKGKEKKELNARIKEIKKNYVRLSFDSLSVARHDNIQLYLFTNVRSRLKDVKHLSDKMIALDRKSVELPYATLIADSAKMAEKIFFVNIPTLAIRQQMLQNSSVDAVIVADPYAARLKTQNHKLLNHSVPSPKNAGCLLSKAGVENYQKLYNAACDSINKYGVHHYDSVLTRRMGATQPSLRNIKTKEFSKMK